MWDAPGMQRIKIPMGRLSTAQLEVLADLCEEYCDGILHVTTRQDIQLHFVHIEDTPDLMRRLAAVDITTREACGNTVRNVTACPLAGVCKTEAFDVTPYAHAMTYFLLGHDDTQDFGRKFKVAFSGCHEEACGLTNFHDVGCIARTRVVRRSGAARLRLLRRRRPGQRALRRAVDGGVPARGGTAAADPGHRPGVRPHGREGQARPGPAEVPGEEAGLPGVLRIVREERATLQTDPRWTAFLADLHAIDEKPLRPAGSGDAADPGRGPGRLGPVATCSTQRQAGYRVVILKLPLGDLTADQARAVADIARQYTGDTLRTTADQNLVLRWVSTSDLPAVYAALVKAKLHEPGADTITDITACPGTDTCKLGISSSRALAAELRHQLVAAGTDQNDHARSLQHQDQRLLQQLRPAPRGRPRASWASAATSAAAGCPTSSW